MGVPLPSDVPSTSRGGVGSFHQWKNNTHPKWWRDPGLRKNVGWVMTLYLGVFAFGYDASLMNGLQALPQWNEYFNHPTGLRLGLIVASIMFPIIIVAPIASWCLDRFGRRFTVSVGSFVLIVGPVIGGLAQNESTLIAGRVLIGGSSCFTIIACSCLINELLHPKIRGVFSSLFMFAMMSGTIVGSWVTFGTLNWQSPWSWRLPLLLQVISPVNGQREKAHDILARYHANGDRDDELVKNELIQIVTRIEKEEGEQASWRAFVSTPGNRRRTLLVFLTFTGPVITGLTVVGSYMVPTLRMVGITSPAQLSGVNGGYSVILAMGCLVGAFCTDKLGRRPMYLISTSAMLVFFSVLTALMAVFSHSPLPSLAIAYVVVLYLFVFANNFSWSALVGVYPPEILPFSLRAKGIALGNFLLAFCSSFNTFVNPIALEAIGWKYYAVYIGIIAVYLGLLWAFLIETKGRTIEEIAELFDGSESQYELEKNIQGEGVIASEPRCSSEIKIDAL
ncbi:hexose transporter protein [Moniliophthora roreri MCA 2997]|uniref:Hexose transporter protein n=1 Tax=Moniliophthora roreri (strain MCA 2997) TaxID=1381753 RepID=V2XD43_MONRO|nr:hexose transporter protein [Moniliophthora roreri MCA 2997]